MRAIDGDTLIDWIDPGHLRHPSELCFSELDVVNMINHAPTIEPERKKGKWIKVCEYKYQYKCDRCGETFVGAWDFCGNCGADMRSEDERTDS